MNPITIDRTRRGIGTTTRGFSLIEVMLAVLILSVGLLALALLQASLVRGAASAKAQSVGISLAEDKVESLVKFMNDTDFTGDIIGGSESITQNGTAYTRTVAVTRYYQTAGTSTYSSSTNAGVVSGTTDYTSDFKQVDVTVAWTGATGSAESVVMRDVVSRVNPHDSGSVLTDSTVTRPEPQVRIFEPTETGIIPIAYGDNEDTASASSNPKPVQEDTGAGATITRFNVQTYTNESGQNPLLTRRLEFAVVSCTCELSATDSSTTNVAYEPSFWDGSEYTEPRTVTGKRTADAVDLINNQQDNDQFDLLCQSCCHDHHDSRSSSQYGASVAMRTAAQVDSETPPPYRFDPFRPDGTNSTASDYDATSGDHRLYDNTNYANPSSPTFVEATATGAQYLQTCRLIRVNGTNHVTVDTRLENLVTIRTLPNSRASEDSSSVTLNTTDVANYQDFARLYLLGAVGNNGVSGNNSISLPTGYPVVPLSNQMFSDTAQTTESALTTTYDDDNDTAGTSTTNLLNNSNSRKQSISTADYYYNVHMRGLYIDFVSREAQTAVACIGQGSDPACVNFANSPLLDVIPFFAVNLTNLTVWSKPNDTSNAILYALDNGFPQTYGEDFTRAVVQAKSNNETPVKGTSYRGNESLTDQVITDPHDGGASITEIISGSPVTRSYASIATYGKSNYSDTEQIVSIGSGSAATFTIQLSCVGSNSICGGNGGTTFNGRLDQIPVYIKFTSAVSGDSPNTGTTCAIDATATTPNNNGNRTCELTNLTGVGTIALSFSLYNKCVPNNPNTACQNSSKQYTFCGLQPSTGTIGSVTFSHASPAAYRNPTSSFNFTNEVIWETLTSNANNMETTLPAFAGTLNAIFVPNGDTCPAGPQ